MQGLLGTLFENPLLFTVIAVALLFSVTIHEFSHAFVAFKLGDPTAKNLGRMSLNPLAHLDPLGTIALLIVGFGWGKAVPVDYYNLKKPKRDAALISLAGPASNFILAVLLIVFLKLIGLLLSSTNATGSSVGFFILSTFLYPTILYNIVLGVFNLLPIEPLDGFKIVNGILPSKLSVQWVQLAPYGIYILILLIATNSISRILNPVINLVTETLTF